MDEKNKKLAENYTKKIKFLANLNIIEIKESIIKNVIQKKQFESKKILEKIPKNSQVYVFDVQGSHFTSKEFSDFLEFSSVTFIIGGSNGLSSCLFDNYPKISFSKLTFPHQLFRIMVLEQIFRGLSIKKNMKYHK